jgi:cytochrome P450
MAEQFRRWMHRFNESTSLAVLNRQPDIYVQLARLIRTHNGSPGILADVQSSWRTRQHLGGHGPATMADYVALVWALIAAGTDTPGTVAAQSVWFAVLHGSFPELTSRDAATRAVAEALRYYPPFTKPLMRVRGDVPLGGEVAHRGEWIELHLPAMNRDPAFFDRPHVYDARRKDAAAARTFGGGAHRCIGNHYGTRVGEQIVVTLAERFPRMGPIPGHGYSRQAGLLHRLEELPLRACL